MGLPLENNLSQAPRRSVRILNDIVVNQIAAGEVVERPASVVKELVENSIDAGATEITVVADNGGRSNIEVLDNGCGLTKQDALLAIDRFGTSKISSVEDLLNIQTLGFRGEALPSIAAVSRFKLISGVEGCQAVEINIEGGKLREVLDIQATQGTRIQVRHLFFNVPARRKFLRSERTENGLIRSVLSDFAAAYPYIKFRLIVDGSEVFYYGTVESFFDRVKQLHVIGDRPLRISRQMFLSEGGESTVEGILSEPELSLTTAGGLRLILNGRVIRDRLLLKAIRDGYGNMLKPGRYPVGVIKISVPFSEVDVNVHPQKTEVRFRNPGQIYNLVSQAVAEKFRSVGSDRLLKAENNVIWQVGKPKETLVTTVSSNLKFEFKPGIESKRENVESITPLPVESVSQMHFVGQVLGCYLVLEENDKVVWVDMHAAHERVTFYRLKKQIISGEVVAQQLLLPEVFSFSPEIIEKVISAIPLLKKLGFECDQFGEESVIVRSIPALLSSTQIRPMFIEMFSEPEWVSWEETVESQFDQVISRLACHGSIRSGRELKAPEVYQLLDDLEQAECSAFCPHGRPVIKVFTKYEIESMFGRVQ